MTIVADSKQQYISHREKMGYSTELLKNTDDTDELWRVIRKLSDDSAMLVVLALEENETMTSRELHEETKLPLSNINHALTDLKNLKVIKQDKESKKHELTKYGKVILKALDSLIIQVSRPDLN
ncbi:MAG: hypothetical protein AB7V04_00960 [Desulfomonilaceae bacterium]